MSGDVTERRWTDRVVSMRGFTAAVAHVPNDNPQVQSGHFALGLDGEGPERRLAISIRHADGTGLIVYLSDLAMGRFGDLVADAFGEAIVAAAMPASRLVQ